MSIAQLRDRAKAGFPLVYLRTYEEYRALREIEAWCGKARRRFVLWSTEEGWSFENEAAKRNKGSVSRRANSDYADLSRPMAAQQAPPQTDPREGLTTDPLAAIRMIPGITSGRDAQNGVVIVMLDFHLFLPDQGANAVLIGAIKHVAPLCKESGKLIVFLSCRACVPPELEKEISVLDYELPDETYLRSVFDTLASRGNVQVIESTISQILEAAKGMTHQEFEDALALSAHIHHKFDLSTLSCINTMKAEVIKKGGLLEYYPKGTGDKMEFVGGLDLLKQWLASRKRSFTDVKEASEFGLPTPRGILLCGVPGSGKSIVAKAVANCWGLPLLRFDPGKAFGSLVGQSEERIRMVCKQASAMASCVLWIDEVEKGMSGLGSSGYTDSGVTARVFGTFLTWMQENTAPVFVIATANSIAGLPPELVRRFSEIWSVDLPTSPEREEIWKIHITKPRLAHKGRKVEDFELDRLVEQSVGLSGAEIEKAYLDGLMRAFEEDREVTTRDVLVGCMSITPISRSMSEQIAATRAWCQAHARPASSLVENLKEESGVGFKNLIQNRKLDISDDDQPDTKKG